MHTTQQLKLWNGFLMSTQEYTTILSQQTCFASNFLARCHVCYWIYLHVYRLMECILSLQFPNGNQYCTFPFFKPRIRYSNLFPISVYAYIILLRSSSSFELFYPWVFLFCAQVGRQVGTLLDTARREKSSNSIIFISASTGIRFWSMYDNREAHTTSL